VATGLIASAQFVDEMLQMGRMVRRVGAKHLLQAFAYGIADRSAGLAIERFNVICGWTFHGRFRALTKVGSGDGISSRITKISFS
jgi:hypothetical protein